MVVFSVRIVDKCTLSEVGKVEHTDVHGHFMKQLHNKQSIPFLLFILSTKVNNFAYYHAHHWNNIKDSHQIEIWDKVLATNVERLVLWRIVCLSSFNKLIIVPSWILQGLQEKEWKRKQRRGNPDQNYKGVLYDKHDLQSSQLMRSKDASNTDEVSKSNQNESKVKDKLCICVLILSVVNGRGIRWSWNPKTPRLIWSGVKVNIWTLGK